MNDYDAYEDILIKDVMFTIVFAIIAVIALVVVEYIVIKFKLFDLKKIEIIVATIILAIILIVYMSHVVFHAANIISDINEEAYINYNGEFNISETKDSTITINYEDEDIYLYNNNRIKGGLYNGNLVFSKKSKIVLEIRIENKID